MAIILKANQAPIRLMNKTACHTQTEVENVCNCLHLSSRTFVPTPPTLMHVYNHIKKGHITHIHSCNHDGFQSKGSLVAQTDICSQKIYYRNIQATILCDGLHIKMEGPPAPETLNLHKSQKAVSYH